MAEFEAGPDGFSRRHYEAIAGVLAGCEPPRDESGERHAWRRICGELADMLESSNPRFNRARFLKACGLSNG